MTTSYDYDSARMHAGVKYMWWLWLFPVLGGLIVVGLCLYVLGLAGRVDRELDDLLGELGADEAVPGPALSGTNDMCLVMHILNPIEVARSNSRLGGVAGSVSPGLISRKIYGQMSDQLQDQLAEHGIAAQITVKRGQS